MEWAKRRATVAANAQLKQQLFETTRPLAADAHIKIEVHRDIKIRDYLYAEKQENMNLMFYDFNGSSMFSAASTAQNFHKG